MWRVKEVVNQYNARWSSLCYRDLESTEEKKAWGQRGPERERGKGPSVRLSSQQVVQEVEMRCYCNRQTNRKPRSP